MKYFVSRRNTAINGNTGVNHYKNSKVKKNIIFFLSIFFIVLFLSEFSLAGTDVLAGSQDDAIATMENTGRKWLYLIDGVACVAAFTKRKDPFIFGSIVVVILFLNFIIFLAK